MSPANTPAAPSLVVLVTAEQTRAQAAEDAFAPLSGVWTSYSPAASAAFGSGFAPGNGTLVGRYVQMGKTVIGSILFTLGSTTVISGLPLFTLPVTALAADWPVEVMLKKPLSNWWVGASFALNTNSILVAAVGASGATAFTAALPMTWAAGDSIWASFTYEAA
jgi:hypothetical protein